MIAKNNATMNQTLAGFRTMSPDVMRGEVSYAQTQRAIRSLNDYADSVGGDPADLGKPGTATVGGFEVDIAVDERGTTTITGVRDDFVKDWIGNIAITDQQLDKKEKEKEAREKSEKETADLGAGMSDTNTATQDEDQQASDPAETGTAQAEAETFTAVGGFIPKKLKKKQKKKKRGGLASR